MEDKKTKGSLGEVTNTYSRGNLADVEFLKIGAFHYLMGVLGVKEFHFPLTLLHELANQKLLEIAMDGHFAHFTAVTPEEAEARKAADQEAQAKTQAAKTVH